MHLVMLGHLTGFDSESKPKSSEVNKVFGAG